MFPLKREHAFFCCGGQVKLGYTGGKWLEDVLRLTKEL